MDGTGQDLVERKSGIMPLGNGEISTQQDQPNDLQQTLVGWLVGTLR